MRREIFYEERVILQLADLGDLKRLDERMAVLEWALWLDAEDFPIVDGFARLRVARLYGDGEPTLRVYFQIENGSVTVLFVEPIPT